MIVISILTLLVSTVGQTMSADIPVEELTVNSTITPADQTNVTEKLTTEKNMLVVPDKDMPPATLTKSLVIEDTDALTSTQKGFIQNTDEISTSASDVSAIDDMPISRTTESMDSFEMAEDHSDNVLNPTKATERLYYDDIPSDKTGTLNFYTAIAKQTETKLKENKTHLAIDAKISDKVTLTGSTEPYSTIVVSTESSNDEIRVVTLAVTEHAEEEVIAESTGYEIFYTSNETFPNTNSTMERQVHRIPITEYDLEKQINESFGLRGNATAEIVGDETIPSVSIEKAYESEDKIESLTDYPSSEYDYLSASNKAPTTTATRIPKKIQSGQDRYPEGRVRPARPDPGYANNEGIDLVRPYRPDSPLVQYPYFRPTPDDRTPIIRQDTDYTRPARPDPESVRPSFKPNYGYTRPSSEDRYFTRQSSPTPISNHYRPTFNRPYVPQGSFGKPYRPDYQRPSKPSGDTLLNKSSPSGHSTSGVEENEHSKGDFDYTRQSENSPGYSLSPFVDNHRPANLEVVKKFTPNRPSYDTFTDSSIKYQSGVSDTGVKVSNPSFESSRPGSLYPNPVYVDVHPGYDTSVKPFSVGIVTSAKNLTRVEFIKADCFDNHMKVTMRFNGTFDGLVYSSGYAQDAACSYVNGSGRNHYEFFIRLNRCGTLGQQEVAGDDALAYRRRQDRAQYLVNTVTVQYNPIIEEDIDEHFRVTCEYGYDFWKTVTFPVINVESASVKLRTGSPVVFTLPPPQCNMEVRSGFGPAGNRIMGPVNVGDPITLVIHMKSESAGFDILVSNCYAHNGGQKRLQLIDSHGCVIQDKLISPFRGVNNPERAQQVTLYSYLKAFRFTGSPALYLECDVHMCHGSCPPQRCYWRNLYKRSAEEKSPKPTTETDTVISESVSLFQALEVRHEDAESPLALRSLHWEHKDMVCIRTMGFAVIAACILTLLLISTAAAILLCTRMQKMKRDMKDPDTNHFIQFNLK